MLEHEHSLRDELDPAWAIWSLALTTGEGRSALVLEDLGGELLVRRVGTPMDVGEALRVGASLATALHQLHGRGLIHKRRSSTPAPNGVCWSSLGARNCGFGRKGAPAAARFPIGLRDIPLGGATLPESVVRYAARVHETVNLDDASTQGGFWNDEYIRREHAKSVLCLPLLQQGRLMALLYLENNLAAGVFTPARLAVLNVLASQAAMSLEKTRLYEELRQREAKIRRLVDTNVVGVLVSTLDGRVIEANDAVLRLVGYSRDDLMSGRTRWPDWTPPEWRASSERAVAQIAAQGKCDLFEKEYVRKDGSRAGAHCRRGDRGDERRDCGLCAGSQRTQAGR